MLGVGSLRTKIRTLNSITYLQNSIKTSPNKFVHLYFMLLDLVLIAVIFVAKQIEEDEEFARQLSKTWSNESAATASAVGKSKEFTKGDHLIS